MTLHLNLIEKNGGKNIENLFMNTMLVIYIYIVIYLFILIFFSCLHICKDGERLWLYVGCGKYL
jgi:hypothetical protein